MVTLIEAKIHLRLDAYSPDDSGGESLMDNHDDASVEKMIDAAVDHLQAVGVDMTADPLPAALHHAVLMLVAHFYENREAATEEQLKFTPFGVDRLIAPYRSVVL